MPVNKQITDYLSTHLRQGYDINALRSQLLSSGWPHQDVEDSIASLPGHGHGGAPSPPSQQSRNLGIFTRFKMALFRPGELFTAIKGEEGCGKAFKYYAIFSAFMLLGVVFSILMGVASIIPQMTGAFALFSMLTLGGLIFFLVIILFYIFTLAAIFLSALIQHIGVIIFGGKGGYYQTFKATVYGMTSPHVISFIPLLILYLLSALGLFPETAIVYIVWVYMGILLTFGLWGFYIMARGVSKLHDVSFLRAVAMLMIIPLILMIITVAGSVWTYLSLTSYMDGLTTSGIEVRDSFCAGSNTATIIVTNIGESTINVADITVMDTESGTKVSGSWKESSDPNKEITTIPAGEAGRWSGTCSDSECEYRLIYKSRMVQTVRIYC